MESVEKIAEAVLYEGYLLFPYRRSTLKNQQRWTFGGVYPRRFSEENGGDDPWNMRTQCLVVGDEDTTIEVKLRFLQVADRHVSQKVAGTLCPVESLRVGEQVYQPWEEAIERTIPVLGRVGEPALRLGDLLARRQAYEIAFPEGSEHEPLIDLAGAEAGELARAWRSLHGVVEVTAEPLDQDPATPRGYRLTVRIANTTPWTLDDANERTLTTETRRHGGSTERNEGRSESSGVGDTEESGPRQDRELTPRQAALRQTFVSTHTILRVHGGEFVSLLEPPDAYQTAAEQCRNMGTWPVLVGEQGERHTMLSSPIILYDYPRIAPESPGNLFDATEIDELLTLSIITLTDEEKREMRESDPKGREILERTESLTPDQIMQLHGAVRGLQTLRTGEQP